MSVKNSRTKGDAISWEAAKNVVNLLIEDRHYVMSAFIAIAIYTGLRVSELRLLKWKDILCKDSIEVERKRSNVIIDINPRLKEIIYICFIKTNTADINSYILLSQKKVVYSIQRLNVLLKEIKEKYNIKCSNFCNQSLRKTFGIHFLDVYSNMSDKEYALVKLCNILGQSNYKETIKFLGVSNIKDINSINLRLL